MNRYYPPAFQGVLTKRKYFEGWYIKTVNPQSGDVLAIIPGISLGDNSHAFIQVINNWDKRTHYVKFPLDDFIASNESFDTQIGSNRFSMKSMELDIDRDDLKLRGTFRFRDITELPRSRFNPSIMGPYIFTPFLECYHGVVSMNHLVEGEVKYQGKSYSFSNSRGYIEKDWGRSMPQRWIWLQSNNLNNSGHSFMFSYARIPFLGRAFDGFLGYYYDGNKTERIGSYNRARIKSLTFSENNLSLIIQKGPILWNIKVDQASVGDLKAPVSGNMDRVIKESPASTLHLLVSHRKKGTLFEGVDSFAGCEMVGDMRMSMVYKSRFRKVLRGRVLQYVDLP